MYNTIFSRLPAADHLAVPAKIETEISMLNYELDVSY